MTCSACAVTVKKSLTRVEGVKDAKVTLSPPQAVVAYDPAKVRVEQLVEATTKAGFPSTIPADGGKR
ncbi:MAG: heavy-metal-associated domain-containing protein [Deltaproteobacteria bacterium]|nr:heavy-metal-associated domain-containing protein [Deltaproteobacteria bacterium]